MKVQSRQVWAGIVACLFASVTAADTSSNFLDVTITLNNPDGVAPPPAISTPSPGVCVSEALSAPANAQVRVICTTGQLFTISAIPGRPFLGTHGSAFRSNFGQNNLPTIPSADELGSRASRPTASPVSSTDTESNDSVEPPEMLVSF